MPLPLKPRRTSRQNASVPSPRVPPHAIDDADSVSLDRVYPRARKGHGHLGTPYVELDREAWQALRASTPLTLDEADISRLRGLGDRIDLREVEEVYLPLSRLLNFYVGATAGLHRITGDFLGESPAKTPFVIGVAGSVAVGKSTTARLLKELLSRWPGTPEVELVTTDGFLYPNA